MLIQIDLDHGNSIVINSNDILRIVQFDVLGDDIPEYLIYLASTNRRIKIDAMQFIELVQKLEIARIELPETHE